MKFKNYILGLLALTSTQANAAVAYVVDTVPAPFSSSAVLDQSIGIDFTIGAFPISVTSLGYFDYDANGLESLSNVAVFEDLGIGGIIKLGEVSISGTAGTMNGNFRYVDLAAPLILMPGNTYRIVGNTGNAGGTSNSLPFTLGTPVDLTLDADIAGVGPDYQATSTPGGVVVHPLLELNNLEVFELPLVNIQYDTIPEPGSALLMGLSALGLLRRRRA